MQKQFQKYYKNYSFDWLADEINKETIIFFNYNVR